ncbi:hypothetical protein [Neoroseomonas eburnea]|uniref:hypothetical protein n=1 Tax=Neoroseomonas eburnea TaxID=1346889 RepID=UPI001BAAB8DF|nr:hypothetical protein [Neoroseomonas eburnea]
MTALAALQRLRDLVAGLERDRRGVTAAEYAILAVGVVVVVASAVVVIGDPLYGAMAIAGQGVLDVQSSIAQSSR